MRKAKFRYVYQHEDTGCIMTKHFTLAEIETGATRQFPRWYPIARNQYVGVKDIDGYEIFEGDIIKDNKGNIGEVKFVDATFAVECKDIWLGLDYPEELEVVGNVYEHHELLEVNNHDKRGKKVGI